MVTKNSEVSKLRTELDSVQNSLQAKSSDFAVIKSKFEQEKALLQQNL
jgi:hypothetical protein